MDDAGRDFPAPEVLFTERRRRFCRERSSALPCEHARRTFSDYWKTERTHLFGSRFETANARGGAIMSMDLKTLIDSLRSKICPACGGAKKPRNTFCSNCYLTLPKPMRVHLYDRVGDGYEEAVTAACDKLKELSATRRGS
jgi:hypothetical protein